MNHTPPTNQIHWNVFSQDREMKVKKMLQKISDQRKLVKKERVKRNIPTIAVVGYTNSGKHLHVGSNFVVLRPISLSIPWKFRVKSQ